jgi:DNA-binding PadR family transcriptional regulator
MPKKNKEGNGTNVSKDLVKGFTELYALLYFKNRPDSSAYDFVKHIQSEYSFKISYSKIYPLLDKLGKAGLLSMREDSGSYPPKKVYKLAPKGTEMTEQYRKGFLGFFESF